MFSPSDYNDAVPQFTNGNYANTPQNPLYVKEPDADNYNRGAEPLQTLPAQWWNWLCNKITAKLNNLNIYVKNIFNELAALLSLVNVTPDATEEDVTTEQLKDMFATKYPQYLQDNFKTEPLLQGRTRGVMVAPTDTWNDNTDTLSLTGGFGIINTYNKVTFSDCDLVIPNDNSVHFIVSDTSGVISIQSTIEDNVILIGLCRQKEYCLLIDNNPDQCKDNIILKKWFGQNKISQDFVPFLQTYYNTAIASIETEIYIETVDNRGIGISNGTYNNCTITIETLNNHGNGISNGTYNNCNITIKTVSNGGVCIDGGTYNNCTITLKTVSGFGISNSTYNNCTINITTVSGNGFGIFGGTFYNCTINITTVSNDGTGIREGTYSNCTITIETVNSGTGIRECTYNNCTINITTVSGNGFGIYFGTLNNCAINIEAVSDNSFGIQEATFNNSIITIKTLGVDSVSCYGIYDGTLDNCTINIGTVGVANSIRGGTLNNCAINITTVSGGNGYGYGIYDGTLDNCTINITTVSGNGTGIYLGTLNNCAINITTVSGGGIGVMSGTLYNCTITIETVNKGTGIGVGTYNNCTFIIKTVKAFGIFGGTFYNCTINITTVSNDGTGIREGTYSNCTITIETVNSGIAINNASTVILYFTYIKCRAITSLLNTAGKLNIINGTVFNSN